jgi:hypothetical protein
MNALLAPLSNAPWVVPAIGLATAAIAFAAAWRFLAARAPAQEADGPAPAGGLYCVAADRRKAPRRKGNCVEVDLAPEGAGSPLYAWVIDRSVGGLRLLLDRPLDEGATVLVRPRTDGEPLPWCPAVIRSCKFAKAEWEVGVQFVRTPSWNIMQLFG